MIAYVFRAIAGFLIGYVMREGMRILFAQGARKAPKTPSAQHATTPVAREPRIHIDHANIVDGDFKPIADREKR